MSTFRATGIRPQPRLRASPFHEWTDAAGEITLQFYRLAHGYLLRFPELVDFEVSFAGQMTSSWAVPGVPPAVVESLFINQVQPLALSRQGKLVLHAGAVEVDSAAVLFLGKSGMGKSTLVAGFAAAGYRFLTDDGVQFSHSNGRHYAMPGHASVRLREDSLKSVGGALHQDTPTGELAKVRIAAGANLQYCDKPLPVAAIFVLGESNTIQPRFREIAPRDTLLELLQHSFLLDIEEQDQLRQHFASLGSLARQGRISVLDYPRAYHMLDRVIECVLKQVRGDARLEIP